VCVQVIMVRGHRGGRRWGARGGGTMPPVASMPEGSNPQGDEQVLGQEQIAVGDVVRMMRSFQCMSEALISHLDRDEARAWHPLRFHRALWSVLVAFTVNSRRSNFPSSLVPRMVQPPRHGWRTWRCASHFAIIPPT
jgi:hypothetical protein